MINYIRRRSLEILKKDNSNGNKNVDKDEGIDNNETKKGSELKSSNGEENKDRKKENEEGLELDASTVANGNNATTASEINHTSPCDRLSFDVGVSENKNSKFRRTMEDVHTYVANFAERLDWGYFAVFDGHAGKQTARWSGTNLHNILYENILKNDGIDLRDNLNNSFIEADQRIKELKISGASGCTAAVAVLRWEEEVEDDGEDDGEKVDEEADGEAGDANKESDSKASTGQENIPFDFVPTSRHKRMLYTANVGDTRVVLSRNSKAIRLSYDHKASDKNEIKRIYNNGGVILKGRVNGVLAVSRSLGDLYLKKFVIGAPFTTATELNIDDSFLIIACDGLWDVCTDQAAVDLIKDVNDSKLASNILCKYAVDHGTTDNVTVMVVKLESRVFDYSN